MVATVRALKYHGGVAKENLNHENLEALSKGLPNLFAKHVENVTRNFGLPCVVAINRFPTDTEAELALVREKCRELGVNVALSEVWSKGGAGGIELAEEVLLLVEGENNFHFVYEDDLPLKEKNRSCRGQNLPRGWRKLYRSRKNNLIPLRNLASASFRSVWPKRSTAFRMIRLF